MKNYLSIAALIAAGTLVSNAALTEVVTLSNFSGNATNGFTASGYTLTPVTNDGTTKNNVTLSNGSLVFSNESPGGVVSTTLNEGTLSSTTGYTLKLEVSGMGKNGAPLVYVDTDTSHAQSLGFGNGGDYASWGIFNSGSTDSKNSGATGTKIGDSFTGTVYFCVSGTAAWVLAKADESAEYTEVVRASAFTATGAAAPTTITIGGWADASATANFTLNSLSVYTGTTTAEALNVPEPSAFGLLAGLGALALVASRRRRK